MHNRRFANATTNTYLFHLSISIKNLLVIFLEFHYTFCCFLCAKRAVITNVRLQLTLLMQLVAFELSLLATHWLPKQLWWVQCSMPMPGVCFVSRSAFTSPMQRTYELLRMLFIMFAYLFIICFPLQYCYCYCGCCILILAMLLLLSVISC